jgi:hypothetical protein
MDATGPQDRERRSHVKRTRCVIGGAVVGSNICSISRAELGELDELDEFEAVVGKVAAAEVDVDVVRLRVAIERLEHVFLERVRAAELRGDWQAAGFLSSAAWLREQCRMTHAAAAGAIELARRLEHLPATSEAFGSGAISRAHAQVIARAATPKRAAAIEGVERSLVLAAEHTSPKQLRDVVQQVTDAIDGDGGAAAANARHERRRLHVSPTLDGMVAIDGLLDAEGGEIVLGALEGAMECARAAGDLRSRPQQRADALVELCGAGARNHAAGPGRRHRPHITVVVDAELLGEQATTAVAPRRRADTEHVGRLPIATIERLLCDAGISRVITRGPSVPIDVGRTTRTIPGALWTALVVRDGGCVVAGCDRSPGWCEVHHKIPWSRGGPTDLANCELRCWRHHRAVHEGGHDPPRRDLDPYAASRSAPRRAR